MQPGSLECLEKFHRPLPEEKRLAAGKRDATTRFVVESLVFKRLRHDFIYCHGLAVEFQRPRGACRLVHSALGVMLA